MCFDRFARSHFTVYMHVYQISRVFADWLPGEWVSFGSFHSVNARFVTLKEKKTLDDTVFLFVCLFVVVFVCFFAVWFEYLNPDQFGQVKHANA